MILDYKPFVRYDVFPFLFQYEVVNVVPNRSFTFPKIFKITWYCLFFFMYNLNSTLFRREIEIDVKLVGNLLWIIILPWNRSLSDHFCNCVYQDSKKVTQSIVFKRWGGNRYFSTNLYPLQTTFPQTCTLYKPVLITKLYCFTNLYCILTSTELGYVLSFALGFSCFTLLFVSFMYGCTVYVCLSWA